MVLGTENLKKKKDQPKNGISNFLTYKVSNTDNNDQEEEESEKKISNNSKKVVNKVDR